MIAAELGSAIVDNAVFELRFDGGSKGACAPLFAWRETVQGIFRVGDLLAEAQGDPACRFDEMKLPFRRSAVYALMAVARRQWFRRVQYTGHLPAAWATLEVLQRFDEKERLPFGYNTRQRLIAVAADQRLRAMAHGPALPAHWRTLYELTHLDDGFRI